MPQLVEIPAPVNTTTFFAAAKVLAIFCSCRLFSVLISSIGMLIAIYPKASSTGFDVEFEQSDWHSE